MYNYSFYTKHVFLPKFIWPKNLSKVKALTQISLNLVFLHSVLKMDQYISDICYLVMMRIPVITDDSHLLSINEICLDWKDFKQRMNKSSSSRNHQCFHARSHNFKDKESQKLKNLWISYFKIMSNPNPISI